MRHDMIEQKRFKYANGLTRFVRWSKTGNGKWSVFYKCYGQDYFARKLELFLVEEEAKTRYDEVVKEYMELQPTVVTDI